MSDFQVKTSQCTPVKNASKLSKSMYKTCKRSTSFEISEDEILLIAKNLNVDKAHKWNKLSVRMINIWCKSLTPLFKLMFSSMLYEVVKPKSKKM